MSLVARSKTAPGPVCSRPRLVLSGQPGCSALAVTLVPAHRREQHVQQLGQVVCRRRAVVVF